jgi:sporulation protein YlmC with PRC-barrel domain
MSREAVCVGGAAQAVSLSHFIPPTSVFERMKKMVSNVLRAMALMAVAGWTIGSVTAAENDYLQNQSNQPNQPQHSYSTSMDRSAQPQSAKSIVRASELIGTDVKNNANEDLGEIKDLAINPSTGSIQYAAVSMGGFLGMGDKLFAVPWSALECRTEAGTVPGESGTHVAILNVSKETLKNAKGFDEDNWPDMANDQWKRDNDRPYGTSMNRPLDSSRTQ